jgi:hypothetical protein
MYTHQHELLSEGGAEENANARVWDERVGDAVWRTWPGRMLLLCNAGMLVVS